MAMRQIPAVIIEQKEPGAQAPRRLECVGPGEDDGSVLMLVTLKNYPGLSDLTRFAWTCT